MLVNSSGHCQYLPPGKTHFLCPPIVRQLKRVEGASPSGLHTSVGHPRSHPTPSCFLPLCVCTYSLKVTMPSSSFLSWGHGSNCLYRLVSYDLIVCQVFFKVNPQLKEVSLIRSLPVLLIACKAQTLAFPSSISAGCFPSHQTGAAALQVLGAR